MVERVDNTIQAFVLIVCFLAASVKAYKTPAKVWMLLVLFYISWGTDVVYWLIYLIFEGEIPELSVTANLSWYAAYIFQYMLIREASPPKTRTDKHLLPWLGPVFTVGMAIFYMQWGAYVSNVICGLLMGLLMYSTVRRLMDPGEKPCHFLCALILIVCLLEYGLWTSSCFFEQDSLANPYYWFDFMVTLSFPFFIPAVKKAVTA